MGKAIVSSASGPIASISAASSAAAVLNYDPSEACGAGTTRLYQGFPVIANAAVAANTPFSWGTTGATWSPVEYGASFKGIYAAGTTYAVNEIVAADATSTAMYKSLAAGNLGNLLSNATKWAAASFTVAPAMSLPILAYQIGETYYVGQHICYNGLIVTPNATIPAGTAFAFGSSGATFKIDKDTAGAYYQQSVGATLYEYDSPFQHGGIYGPIKRVYFGATLPTALTSGNYVSKLLTYELGLNTPINNRSRIIGHAPNMGNIDLNGTSGKSFLGFGLAGGYTITDGWVDYAK